MNLNGKNSLFGYKLSRTLIFCLLALIFVVSLAVRYYPIYHRGYPWGINSDNLILARNLHFANNYSFENKLNVILSYDSLGQQGIAAQNGSNRLTSEIYAKVFDWFGFKPNLPIYFSILLFSLTTILLVVLVWQFFNFTLALIFGLVDIFVPIILAGSNLAGFYEWAMLFFSLALILYFLSFKYRKKELEGADDYKSLVCLLLASFLFGMTILARNAFLISFGAFVIFELFSFRSIKRVAILLIPALVLLFIFLYPGYFYKEHSYYFAQGVEKTYDGHLFPDPYTFHFNRDNFLDEYKSKASGSEVNTLIAYGYLNSWEAKVKQYFVSSFRYLNFTLRLPTLGGSFGLFLAVLGLFLLYFKNKTLFKLSAIWVFVWITGLVVLRTGNVDHFLELRFVLGLLIALGIFGIIEAINNYELKNKFKYLLIVGIFLACFGHFVEADKWMFHENYESSYMEKQNVMELVKTLKENDQQITDKDVIATTGGDMVVLALAYYTNHSFIYFNQDTVTELIKKGKLQDAFDRFEVTKIVGYNLDLTKEIIKNTRNVAEIKD